MTISPELAAALEHKEVCLPKAISSDPKSMISKADLGCESEIDQDDAKESIEISTQK
jgi:hypothetical protein